ncbi:MAG: tRNA lysidine(34) synthetase TilS [Pseudomonadota bacterium]
MSVKLLKKVKQAIDRYRMLHLGDGVVVAVSGGPDSVALLGILKHFSAEYNLKLVVAHLNHGLRPGPADEEEALVHRLCAHMGLVCESKKIDITALSRVRKTSVEETAREERYCFFEVIRGQYDARKIALGHHAGDQAETVLMNLMRGSGREGLRGMQAVREERFIRPLLGVTRAEISEYLTRQDLPYLIDQSNTDEHCFRNRIRHRLIPELKTRYNPRLEETLCRTAEILSLEDDYLKRTVEEHVADRRMVEIDSVHQEIRINIPLFLGLHEALRSRLIKHLLLGHTQQKQGIGHVHIRGVEALMQCGHSSGSLHLPFGREVRRKNNSLVIGRRIKPPRVSKTAVQGHEEASAGHSAVGMIACDIIKIPGQVRIEALKMTLWLDFVERSAVCFGDSRTVYMDYACIVPPLVVRTPQPGDRIQPLGMTGMKKLKRYFIDEKIPVRLRGQVPIFVDGHSVIWIVGQLLGERVKLTDKTRKILKIEQTEKI